MHGKLNGNCRTNLVSSMVTAEPGKFNSICRTHLVGSMATNEPSQLNGNSRAQLVGSMATPEPSQLNQSKWTNGRILTKIIGTYKSEIPGNSSGNYFILHEFHSLLICNCVK